ncbi:hypothetical protein ACHAPD_004592 [Fusarium lateritium]
MAANEEKEKCSWNGTFGPAINALKDLGRAGVNKDWGKLAEHAKARQQAVAVEVGCLIVLQRYGTRIQRRCHMLIGQV